MLPRLSSAPSTSPTSPRQKLRRTFSALSDTGEYINPQSLRLQLVDVVCDDEIAIDDVEDDPRAPADTPEPERVILTPAIAKVRPPWNTMTPLLPRHGRGHSDQVAVPYGQRDSVSTVWFAGDRSQRRSTDIGFTSIAPGSPAPHDASISGLGGGLHWNMSDREAPLPPLDAAPSPNDATASEDTRRVPGLHLLAMLKKNMIQKSRARMSLFGEIFLPVVFILGLVAIWMTSAETPVAATQFPHSNTSFENTPKALGMIADVFCVAEGHYPPTPRNFIPIQGKLVDFYFDIGAALRSILREQQDPVRVVPSAPPFALNKTLADINAIRGFDACPTATNAGGRKVAIDSFCFAPTGIWGVAFCARTNVDITSLIDSPPPLTVPSMDALFVMHRIARALAPAGDTPKYISALVHSSALYVAPNTSETRALVAHLTKTTMSFKYRFLEGGGVYETVDDALSKWKEDPRAKFAWGLLEVRSMSKHSGSDIVMHMLRSSVPLTNSLVDRFAQGLGDFNSRAYVSAGFLTLQNAISEYYVNEILGGEAEHRSQSSSGTPSEMRSSAAPSSPLLEQPNVNTSIVPLPPPLSTRSVVQASVGEAGGSVPWWGFFSKLQYGPVSLLPMPFGKYTKSEFLNTVEQIAPMAMVFGFLYPVSQLTKRLVEEKETRAREAMMIMGLDTASFYVSWVLTYTAITGATAVLCTAVMVLTFLSNCGIGIVFALFFSFGLSTIAMSILLSALFSSSRVAALVAPVVFFIVSVPSFALNSDTEPMLLLSLSGLSPTAFALGTGLLLGYQRTTGIDVTSLFTPSDDPVPMSTVFLFVLTDTVAYLALAVYLDAVLPQQWGTTRHPLFFIVDPWRWVSRRCRTHRHRQSQSRRGTLLQTADHDETAGGDGATAADEALALEAQSSSDAFFDESDRLALTAAAKAHGWVVDDDGVPDSRDPDGEYEDHALAAADSASEGDAMSQLGTPQVPGSALLGDGWGRSSTTPRGPLQASGAANFGMSVSTSSLAPYTPSVVRSGPPIAGASTNLVPLQASTSSMPEAHDRVRTAGSLRGPSVSLRGLRKEFDVAGATFVAVDNLTLDFHENEVTVLLGHNGAGKTTAINVMTGMLAATSGDCFVYGKSITHDLHAARAEIGICPQHNILWDGLTCQEHLEFFAALKGVPAQEVKTMAIDMLAAVDLKDKANAFATDLSGGQKRKLSVAIAFIGGSRMVFLDEPTAGMDVAARRFTWDLIKKMSPGRTIVLTTHFMDEADLLGDTIAIMSEGRLRCAGSPLFLKSRLGVGYTLTLSLQQRTHTATADRPHELSAAGPNPLTPAGVPPTPSNFAAPASPAVQPFVVDRDRIVNVIRRFVPDAAVVTNSAGELALRLPMVSVPAFPHLLRTLESDGRSLGIEAHGIAVTTLEEVFLQIGKIIEQKRLRREEIEEQLQSLAGEEIPAPAPTNSDPPTSDRHRKMSVEIQKVAADLALVQDTETEEGSTLSPSSSQIPPPHDVTSTAPPVTSFSPATTGLAVSPATAADLRQQHSNQTEQPPPATSWLSAADEVPGASLIAPSEEDGVSTTSSVRTIDPHSDSTATVHDAGRPSPPPAAHTENETATDTVVVHPPPALRRTASQDHHVLHGAAPSPPLQDGAASLHSLTDAAIIVQQPTLVGDAASVGENQSSSDATMVVHPPPGGPDGHRVWPSTVSSEAASLGLMGPQDLALFARLDGRGGRPGPDHSPQSESNERQNDSSFMGGGAPLEVRPHGHRTWASLGSNDDGSHLGMPEFPGSSVNSSRRHTHRRDWASGATSNDSVRIHDDPAIVTVPAAVVPPSLLEHATHAQQQEAQQDSEQQRRELPDPDAHRRWQSQPTGHTNADSLPQRRPPLAPPGSSSPSGATTATPSPSVAHSDAPAQPPVATLAAQVLAAHDSASQGSVRSPPSGTPTPGHERTRSDMEKHGLPPRSPGRSKQVQFAEDVDPPSAKAFSPSRVMTPAHGLLHRTSSGEAAMVSNTEAMLMSPNRAALTRGTPTHKRAISAPSFGAAVALTPRLATMSFNDSVATFEASLPMSARRKDGPGFEASLSASASVSALRLPPRSTTTSTSLSPPKDSSSIHSARLSPESGPQSSIRAPGHRRQISDSTRRRMDRGEAMTGVESRKRLLRVAIDPIALPDDDEEEMVSVIGEAAETERRTSLLDSSVRKRTPTTHTRRHSRTGSGLLTTPLKFIRENLRIDIGPKSPVDILDKKSLLSDPSSAMTGSALYGSGSGSGSGSNGSASFGLGARSAASSEVPVWNRVTPRCSLRRQFVATVIKRWQNAKRDRRTQVMQVVLPVAGIILAMALTLVDFSPAPELDMSPAEYKDGEVEAYAADCFDGFAAELPPTHIIDQMTANVASTNATSRVTPAQMSDALLATVSKHEHERVSSFICGSPGDHQPWTSPSTGSGNAPQRSPYENTTFPTFTVLQLINGSLTKVNVTGASVALGMMTNETRYRHSAPMALNAWHNAVARTLQKQRSKQSPTAGAAGPRPMLRVASYPLPMTETNAQLVNSIKTFFVGLFIMIPFTFIPSTYVAWIVKERETKARHLQDVSGMNYVMYWAANLCFDLSSFLFTTALAMAVLFAFGRDEYVGTWENSTAILSLLVLYGVSGATGAYLLSFLFSSHTSAQNVVMMTNFVCGFLLVLATYVLRLLGSASLGQQVAWAFRPVPTFCLGNGVIEMAMNHALNNDPADRHSPWSYDVAGWNVIFMCVEGPLFFGLTLIIDNPRLPGAIARVKKCVGSFCCCYCGFGDEAAQRRMRAVHEEDEEEDVAAERRRITAMLARPLRLNSGRDLPSASPLPTVSSDDAPPGSSQSDQRSQASAPSAKSEAAPRMGQTSTLFQEHKEPRKSSPDALCAVSSSDTVPTPAGDVIPGTEGGESKRGSVASDSKESKELAALTHTDAVQGAAPTLEESIRRAQAQSSNDDNASILMRDSTGIFTARTFSAVTARPNRSQEGSERDTMSAGALPEMKEGATDAALSVGAEAIRSEQDRQQSETLEPNASSNFTASMTQYSAAATPDMLQAAMHADTARFTPASTASPQTADAASPATAYPCPASPNPQQQLERQRAQVPPSATLQDNKSTSQASGQSTRTTPALEAESDLVIVSSLHKAYAVGTNVAESGVKVAVRDLTFGVKRGEVFGFLGTNGAGKTTTMSVLCGEQLPSAGVGLVAGHDVVRSPAAARAALGYCPQFDALLDLLTVEEHLELYGRLRGLDDDDLAEVVDALVERCDLSAHRLKEARSLSGGNKRKLSVAIALVGGPQVLFLDEPSAGMDPGARRGLWDVIDSVAQHCSIVLTTHHLEEIEALSSRVAIMDQGEMKCIGPLQHLKFKFGSGFEMALRVRSERHVSRLKRFIAKAIPAAELQEQHGLKLTYALPQNALLSKVFAVVEARKEALRVTDYSVSQTSLESVFLKIADQKRHTDE